MVKHSGLFCDIIYQRECYGAKAMSDAIYKLIKWITEELNNRKNYFAAAKKQITASNLKVLVAANMAVAVSLIAFIFFTPLIIKDWTPTVYHLSFLPAIFILCVITSCYYLKTGAHAAEQTVNCLCALSIVLITIFCILIDTAGNPGARSTFSDMMFIVLPAILILPAQRAYSIIAVLEALYIAAILIFKEQRVGQYDIFSSIVALACSVVVFNIITYLRARDYNIQEKYKELSMIDGLTGVFNKQSSLDKLDTYLKKRNDNTDCVLLLIDLDDFKGINDRYGHSTGDSVLKHMGIILREVFWQTDIVGRFGGDEFIVLVKGMMSEKKIQEKCDSIWERLAEHFESDEEIHISCSFGAVMVKGREGNVKSLFQQADAALYEAKRGGKAKCVIRMYEKNTPNIQG